MKVKEIMIKEVVSLKPDDNARDALDILFNRHISGLPVIDDKGKLAGMFTEKGIIAKILPSYVDKVGKFIYEENPKAVKQKALALANLKVKDIMRSEVVAVGENTTLCEVARLMLTRKARRVPVLNASNIVIGMVAREDVLKALFGEYS